MVQRKKPDDHTLKSFISLNEKSNFSYPEVGLSRTNTPLAGYDNDLNRVQLGRGEEVYQAACRALKNWEMFPGGWASVGPGLPAIQEGEIVAMVIHLFGFYWVNGCRIVYTFEESGVVKKLGFAYGTLPNHVERGEERFSVEMLADGTVWYDLRAYSKPRFWLARLGYPLARFFQRRFVQESQRAMQRAVWEDARIRIEKEAEAAEGMSQKNWA